MATMFRMVHPKKDRERFALVGFSWSYLFLGPLVPLVRGHLSWFFLSLILLILAIITFGIMLIVHIIVAFFYNDFHYKWLIKKGYVGTGDGGTIKLYKDELKEERAQSWQELKDMFKRKDSDTED